MISVHFQGKLVNIIVVQDYVPTSNAEEIEVEGLWRPTRPSRTNTHWRISVGWFIYIFFSFEINKYTKEK